MNMCAPPTHPRQVVQHRYRVLLSLSSTILLVQDEYTRPIE